MAGFRQPRDSAMYIRPGARRDRRTARGTCARMVFLFASVGAFALCSPVREQRGGGADGLAPDDWGAAVDVRLRDGGSADSAVAALDGGADSWVVSCSDCLDYEGGCGDLPCGDEGARCDWPADCFGYVNFCECEGGSWRCAVTSCPDVVDDRDANLGDVGSEPEVADAQPAMDSSENGDWNPPGCTVDEDCPATPNENLCLLPKCEASRCSVVEKECGQQTGCAWCDPATGSCVSLCDECPFAECPDDDNACTLPFCDLPAGEVFGICVFIASASPCDDGDPCTVGEVCAAADYPQIAVCELGASLDCNDGDEHTVDWCDSADDDGDPCRHTPP